MKKLLLYLIIFIPFILCGQGALGQPPPKFTADSIPLSDGKVMFEVDFRHDLTKEEFHKRAYAYLDSLLDPYLGRYHLNNEDYTVSRITDYLAIEQSLIQVIAMYMTYTLQLEYQDGLCKLIIKDIAYMEKSYYETQEQSQRKLNMPEYSAKDIMIDKKFSALFTKNTSGKMTDASLKRLNEIVQSLNESFAKP